jgi:hypothetical protein
MNDAEKIRNEDRKVKLVVLLIIIICFLLEKVTGINMFDIMLFISLILFIPMVIFSPKVKSIFKKIFKK